MQSDDQIIFRKLIRTVKLSHKQKQLVFRIIFYSFVFFILLLIPIIYKLFFMTYGIEMMVFFLSPYPIYELIAIISAVLLAEFYLFKKLKIEIENNKLKSNLIQFLIFFIFVSSLIFRVNF